ncbi:MAG: hypothetical protein ACK4WF_04155, partial [Candidatus Brocadiales bacterium]
GGLKMICSLYLTRRQRVERLLDLMSEEERRKVIAEIGEGIKRLRQGLPMGSLAEYIEKALGQERTDELLFLAQEGA